jgi:hypothetical protein
MGWATLWRNFQKNHLLTLVAGADTRRFSHDPEDEVTAEEVLHKLVQVNFPDLIRTKVIEHRRLLLYKLYVLINIHVSNALLQLILSCWRCARRKPHQL